MSMEDLDIISADFAGLVINEGFGKLCGNWNLGEIDGEWPKCHETVLFSKQTILVENMRNVIEK
jgi:hypothetical protein